MENAPKLYLAMPLRAKKKLIKFLNAFVCRPIPICTFVCGGGGFPWYLFFFLFFFFGWLGKSYRQSQNQQKIASNVLNRIINRNGGKTTSNQTTETEIEIATQIGMN